MRKKRAFGAGQALSIVPLVLLGCGLLTFDVESQAETHVDGAGPLGEILDVLDFTGLDDFDIDVQQAMQDQGVDDGDLRDVRLTVFTLTADPGDLSFLDSFSVYMAADGVEEELIASSDNFPAGAPVVTLDVVDVDLSPYVVSDSSSFRVEASGSAPSDDVDITADFTVAITATAQGACSQLNAE